MCAFLGKNSPEGGKWMFIERHAHVNALDQRSQKYVKLPSISFADFMFDDN